MQIARWVHVVVDNCAERAEVLSFLNEVWNVSAAAFAAGGPEQFAVILFDVVLIRVGAGPA
jgi:hypothetical protein